MKFIKNVHGSEASAKPLIVGKTTVYVHTNIHTETITDEMGEHTEWVYDEAQYSRNEWIEKLTTETNKLNEITENMEEEMAESLLSMVEVINDLNEMIEEVSE